MINNENLVNNKAQIEEVREIDNEIPSFEEFMKTYENDANLNYDDLSGGSVGEAEGYGPCSRSDCNCFKKSRVFKLRVRLENQ